MAFAETIPSPKRRFPDLPSATGPLPRSCRAAPPTAQAPSRGGRHRLAISEGRRGLGVQIEGDQMQAGRLARRSHWSPGTSRRREASRAGLSYDAGAIPMAFGVTALILLPAQAQSDSSPAGAAFVKYNHAAVLRRLLCPSVVLV
jgi:hypothetical protein